MNALRSRPRRNGCGLAIALMMLAGCAPTLTSGNAEPNARCSTLTTNAPVVAEQSTIFLGGDAYAAVYRIPSVVTTASGVIIAFAEARPSLNDPGSGDILLVSRRSLDCGRTWQPVQVLADNRPGDAHNPTAVVGPGPDGRNTVFLFFGQRPRSPGGEFDLDTGDGPRTATMWVRTSTDDGATWDSPRNLTTRLKDPSWRVASFGPGQGIVTQWPSADSTVPAGRIIVPGWYSTDGAAGPDEGSFAIYSDDRGRTWQRSTTGALGTGEPQVIQLTDGSIVMDARSDNVRTRFRSVDSGETWTRDTDGLPMVPIMSGVIRHAAARDGDGFDRIIHTGVATDGRFDARIWTSADEGRTWSQPTILSRAVDQYSLATVLPDRTVGFVHETFCLCTDTDGNRAGFAIRFLRFDPERIDPG